jgi:elongation factor P
MSVAGLRRGQTSAGSLTSRIKVQRLRHLTLWHPVLPNPDSRASDRRLSVRAHDGAPQSPRLALIEGRRYHARSFLQALRIGNGGNPMSSYTTNEIRGGMKLLIDGDPYAVIDNEYVKPGKGQAFNRIKVRNLRTGRTVEKSYRSGESIEAADVMDSEMQYLYKDGDFWTFMNPENYEQLQAGEAAVGDAVKWLKDGVVCIITLWNGVPLLVTPPPHIDLKVIETDPGLKGDTATGGQKVAKLETGASVRVPLFINEGEVLRIDTRTGEYVSRAKS